MFEAGIVFQLNQLKSQSIHIQYDIGHNDKSDS